MSIKYTRALLTSALEGKLDDVEFEKDPVFGLETPLSCEGVPPEILNPRNTWQDKKAYDEQSAKLSDLFKDNFKEYEDHVSDAVKNAGPLL